MAAARASDASSSSITPKPKYEVFLSFRGIDTRNKFTSHLFNALKRHGFHTFRDDETLERGEEIGSELLKAIEESRISVIVFSKNYAASKWCLDELVKIMECKETFQHVVLPIFYDVDPSDVRWQKGSLAETFAKHEERFEEGSDGKVKKWREALNEATNLSGWELKTVANGDEAKLIEEVVKKVENILDHGLHVADHPVGVDDRVQKLMSMLRMNSNDVCIVGVLGIGGIGKTTIAKRLYNIIRHKFESNSFLADVSETSKQHDGFVILQERLLRDIFKNGTYRINDVHHGKEVIKRALCRKVLLVLDDVDCVEQLKESAIDRDCFDSGSRIIITTRNGFLLDSLKVDRVYTLKELNKQESIQLFSWHAFHKKYPPTKDYLELSDLIVDYAQGLPLVLEVWGTSLYNRNIPHWRNEIANLNKILDKGIHAKLKLSYDSLRENEQKLFLDLACFFVEIDEDFTVKILKGCSLFEKNEFQGLVDRCLIKYDPGHKKFIMHDLLRDMGREIVRQESPHEPGSRSRVWSHDDALEVLGNGTGIEAVEGILLNFLEPKKFQVNVKAFEKMNRLRLLHLNNVHPSIGTEHIFGRLSWLRWTSFPQKCMPSNLSMENLIALDLSYSKLEQVWNGTKNLDKLKFLDLSHCYFLKKSPNFSGLNSLEELFLNDCIRLVEVGESIGCLNKLVRLDMANCKNLRQLPLEILMLKSLEYLNLSGCSKLRKFAEFKGSLFESWCTYFSSCALQTKNVVSIGLSLQVSSLKTLNMRNCNLSHLPSEIGSLISLTDLDIGENNLCTLPDSICNLTRLQSLDMTRCKLSHLPSEIGSLISLTDLDIGENNLCTLPDSICNLTTLKSLLMRRCNVSQLPVEIGSLISLETLDIGQNNLCTLPDSICNLTSLRVLDMRRLNVSHLPSDIGKLKSLYQLHLDKSNLHTLPDSIRNLTNLSTLMLNNCAMLQSLPMLPASLLRIEGRGCASLECIDELKLLVMKTVMFLYGCPKLVGNNFVDKVAEAVIQQRKVINQSLSLRQRKDNYYLKRPLVDRHDYSLYNLYRIQLSGGEVPRWFEYQCTGSNLSFTLLPLINQKILGLFVCLVFIPTKSSHICCTIHRNTVQIFKFNSRIYGSDETCLKFLPTNELRGGDEVKISVTQIRVEGRRSDDDLLQIKCGAHIIYVVDENIGTEINEEALTVHIPAAFKNFENCIFLG